MLDLDNSDAGVKVYLWVFKTREQARVRKATQERSLNPYKADWGPIFKISVEELNLMHVSPQKCVRNGIYASVTVEEGLVVSSRNRLLKSLSRLL